VALAIAAERALFERTRCFCHLFQFPIIANTAVCLTILIGLAMVSVNGDRPFAHKVYGTSNSVSHTSYVGDTSYVAHTCSGAAAALA
jgi:hypothetical protein